MTETALPAALSDAPPRRGIRHALAKLVLWVVIADVVLISLLAGLRVRQYTWTATAPIRFTGDIANGYAQGTRALELGYWNVYDDVVARARNDQYGLDYSPLRLAVMTLWVRSVHERYPDQDLSRWRPRFTTPLLRFNTACELAGAVAVFLLVRLWVKRDQTSGREYTPFWRRWYLRWHGRLARGMQDTGEPPVPPLEAPPPAAPPWRRPWFAGLAAAVLFWFNPAIIWDAHAWPQWDVWCLPFFLWAAFFASIDAWFVAGLTLAVGAMFKGQILLVAPLLLLWPLFLWKLGAVVRAVAGFGLGVALITFPWLVRTPEAHHWLLWLAPGCLLVFVAPVAAGVVALAAGAVELGVLMQWWALPGFLATHEAALWYPLVLAPVWIAVAWGWTRRGNESGGEEDEARAAKPFFHRFLTRVLGRLRATRAAPYRPVLVALCLSAAAAILLCARLFDGSMSWYAVGFEYGTRHFLNLARGEVCNLPAILQQRFGWSISDLVDGQTTIKQLLAQVYAAALVLCSIGAAWQARRGDRRFLIALTAPWILFFALLPQMHQRYLMWAAGVSALCVGVSFGFTLLHLLISAIAWSMIAHTMLNGDPTFDRGLFELIRGTYPGLSYAVVLLALIFLYAALTRSAGEDRRSKLE